MQQPNERMGVPWNSVHKQSQNSVHLNRILICMKRTVCTSIPWKVFLSSSSPIDVQAGGSTHLTFSRSKLRPTKKDRRRALIWSTATCLFKSRGGFHRNGGKKEQEQDEKKVGQKLERPRLARKRPVEEIAHEMRSNTQLHYFLFL